MDVKTLCLGLLSIRPACGYDLKKEFESIFKHFFPAGYGSIYPALADLANTGLVDCEQVPQTGKPDRKVYRVTESGQRAFAQALQDSTPQHKLRSEFLAMIYFAELMPAERLKSLLEQRVAALLETVAHIDRIEAGWNADTPAGARFVAGFGAAVSKAAADYIEAHESELLTQVSRQRPAQKLRKAGSHNSQGNGVENRP